MKPKIKKLTMNDGQPVFVVYDHNDLPLYALSKEEDAKSKLKEVEDVK